MDCNSILKRLIIPILFFLFLNLQFPSYAQLSTTQIVQTTTTAINKNTTTITNWEISPLNFSTGIKPDLGNMQYSFEKNGTILLNSSEGGLIGFSSPLVNNSAIKLQKTFSNSTLTAYSYFLQKSITQFANITFGYFKIPNSYNLEIKIFGDQTFAPNINVSFPLKFYALQSNCDSLNNSLCDQVKSGNVGLDWSDLVNHNFKSYWSNSTNTLNITLSNSFVLDPLAIDGSVSTRCAAVTSCQSGTFSTTSSPDVIYAGCGTGTASVTFSISDTAALSWTQRKNVAGSAGTETTFDAIASSTLTNDQITCSRTGAAINIIDIVFGISGANTVSPFDSNGAIPSGSSGVSATLSTTISTNNANDMLIGVGTESTSATFTAGSGFTMITQTNGGPTTGGEDNIVSATQTNLAVQITSSANTNWEMIADAVIQSGNNITQPIICAMDNSAPQATVTMSGASITPTTLLCDGNSHSFTASASSTITATEPAATTYTRDRFNDGSGNAVVSITHSTCASGTCTTWSFTNFAQVLNNFTLIAKTPNKFDDDLVLNSFSFSSVGVKLNDTNALGISQIIKFGVSSSTIVSGTGVGATQTWTDYGRIIFFPLIMADNSSSSTRVWNPINSTHTVSPTTGHNDPNNGFVIYYKASSASGGGGSLDYLFPMILSTLLGYVTLQNYKIKGKEK